MRRVVNVGIMTQGIEEDRLDKENDTEEENHIHLQL